MKIKLVKDQYYVGIEGGCHCGRKGEIVNIDALFAKLIKGAYEIVADEKEEIPTKKPLEKMNKDELIKEAKELGIDLPDEDFENMTKAQIMSVIVEVINK